MYANTLVQRIVQVGGAAPPAAAGLRGERDAQLPTASLSRAARALAQPRRPRCLQIKDMLPENSGQTWVSAVWRSAGLQPLLQAAADTQQRVRPERRAR